MAERNTKPANANAANAVRPKIDQNLHQPQMDQAIWLSRASAILRVEEERRRQDLMQMLLNPVAQIMTIPNIRQNSQDHPSENNVKQGNRGG